MQKEKQFTTLDQSIKLKDLGIVQEVSYMIWKKNVCHEETDFRLEPMQYPGCDNKGYSKEGGCLIGYSAFSVAELCVILTGYYSYYNQELKKWVSFNNQDIPVKIVGWYKTQSECLASLLIHLIETKKLTVEECNQRLLAA